MSNSNNRQSFDEVYRALEAEYGSPVSVSAKSSIPEAAEPEKAPSSNTLSASEAAAFLGVTRYTIYRLIARRIFRPLPDIRHKRIPRRQLVDYMNAGR